MQSKIASAIRLELEPVALVWADEKPQRSMEFAPGKWGCTLFLLAAAARGKTPVAGRETFGCFGGGVGLGFGHQDRNFPGGEDQAGCGYNRHSGVSGRRTAGLRSVCTAPRRQSAMARALCGVEAAERSDMLCQIAVKLGRNPRRAWRAAVRRKARQEDSRSVRARPSPGSKQ